MGTVYLTSGHYGLYSAIQHVVPEHRIPLDPEWLERPILDARGNRIFEPYQDFTKAALRALLALPLDSAVSYFAVGERSPQLQEPRQVWGELFLKDPTDVIVPFTHDSRSDDGRPFVHLHQWLEDHWPQHPTREEDATFWHDWSNPARWKLYFELRIRQACNDLREQAKEMQKQAGGLQRKANRIGSLLK